MRINAMQIMAAKAGGGMPARRSNAEPLQAIVEE